MIESATRDLLVMLTAPFYVILISAELLISRLENKKLYSWKDSFHNLCMMLVSSGLEVLVLTLFGFYLLHFSYQFRFFSIENVWVYWIVLYLAEDLIFYLLHYLEHSSRFFWAIHVTHHSSENFNLSVGFRSSAFEPLIRFIFFMPLGFMGFKAADILLMYSITQILGLLSHTQYFKNLGFLEYILATPSNHRVHHGSNTKYLDKNMGMTIMLWDMLFKTFQRELPEEPVHYGLTSSVSQNHPGEILFHEWKNIAHDLKRNDIDWITKLKYVFYAPGWSHDGSRKTSKQLQQEEMVFSEV
jgi:sterol desaturase/sphingolipid hydroxylase (fatty acid hydroxylase superfamily)